ncbi:uncharacterized protein LOC141912725 [Tubulanus polymorphus]|uniref:uncharacterized protein LOC141912725 n=1 Tax=Tubulanus polymorphus TaxID=672921 RepID=UPI003DA4501D
MASKLSNSLNTHDFINENNHISDGEIIRFSVKRLDGDDTVGRPDAVYCIETSPEEESSTICEKIRCLCNVTDDKIIRVRNINGSLVPINKRLINKIHIRNENMRPMYTLEVLNRYQNVKPHPKTTELQKYWNTWKSKLEDYQSRMELLDTAAPQLKYKQQDRIMKEIENIENKLAFINRRIEEAECTKWTGMLKKSPLW